MRWKRANHCGYTTHTSSTRLVRTARALFALPRRLAASVRVLTTGEKKRLIRGFRNCEYSEEAGMSWIYVPRFIFLTERCSQLKQKRVDVIILK
jgi:hypothetical protein